MDKLDDFVRRRTNIVKQLHNQSILYQQFDAIAGFYQKKETAPAVKKAGTAKKGQKRKKMQRASAFLQNVRRIQTAETGGKRRWKQ